MSLKEKMVTALGSGPLTIRGLSDKVYGHHSEAALASARMILVRLRKDGIAIATNKEITYELTPPNPNPESGQNKTLRKRA
jgi:hypothetical protein